MSSLTKVSAGTCVVMFVSLLLITHLYYDLKDSYQLLSSQLTEQIAINEGYKSRIQSLHKLDVIHTQELGNAKAEIGRLRIAADRNPERVYIKARRPKTGSDTATGMDDAATARPDESAVRNYWLLRERIAESEQMIKGLQDYVTQECLK